MRRFVSSCRFVFNQALMAGAGKRWWHGSLSDLHRILTVAYFESIGMRRLA
jgi:hypothetical protein